MMRVLVLLALCGLGSAAAMAQVPKAEIGPGSGTDPRLAQPTIDVLQSLLRLREAEMRALAQDMNAKLAEAQGADGAHQASWAEWYKARDDEWGRYFTSYLAGLEPKAAAAR